MVIVEAIENEAPAPARADEPSAAEQAELVRHCGFGQPDDGRKITYADFTLGQGIEQPHPGRIAEQPERLRERGGSAIADELASKARDGGGIGVGVHTPVISTAGRCSLLW